MPFPFQAVIFDMDGLMLDTEAIARIALQNGTRDLGFELSDEHFASLIGRTSADSSALLQRLFGPDFSVPEFRVRVTHHWDSHVAVHGIARKAGLLELLDYLDTLPIRKAVATSTRRAHAIPNLGDLFPRFDALATGDEVENGKPAPDIFLLAATRLEVKPADCLVLEDSLPGVKGATAAGMQVIMVPDLVSPTPDIALHLASLHDVHAWLKARAEA
jgi:HAD superfamily hydrolase (TIGR01509 family)